MKLTFHGAAGTVTGSMSTLQYNNAHRTNRLMVDCGPFVGAESAEDASKRDFGIIDPKTIGGIFLTHTHTDHVAAAPEMYHRGFRGDIYSNSPTAQMTKTLLRHHSSDYGGKTIIDEVAGLMNSDHGYGEWFEAGEGVKAMFIPAGHVLGSSSVLLEIEDEGEPFRIIFSGDLGNKYKPMINPINLDDLKDLDIDFAVMETTYGYKDQHQEFDGMLQELYDAINGTIKQGGNFYLPAFSIHRTQEYLHHLNEGKRNRILLPDMPIVLDSPLAKKITKVHLDKSNRPYLGDRVRELLEGSVDPFSFDDKSKLKTNNGVIIASSGMCDFGKMPQHLKAGLPNEKDSFAISSWTEDGSTAQKLKDGDKVVVVDGQAIPVNAKVYNFAGCSSHADANQLRDWLHAVNPKYGVFMVHGSEKSRDAIEPTLNGYKVFRPYMNEEFDLTKIRNRAA